MSGAIESRNRRSNKRGAFVDGLWYCDCEPRLPADKFQVKNGGKNHGRWFYTCQKAQHKRCSFFIWSDDAKVREEAAVLSNSRSEPAPPPLPQQPQTPRKSMTSNFPPTPTTNKRASPATTHIAKEAETPKVEHDESFDWSSSNDEELLKVEQTILFETPRKAARTNSVTSPGKRTHDQIYKDIDDSNSWPLSDDIFATPSSSHTLSGRSGLLSPSITPARPPPPQFQLPGHSQVEPDHSALANEALLILKDVQLSSQVERDLIDLLNKHDLRTQGAIKGRDITRVAVQAKETKIAQLEARISVLEAERETNRTVIQHLKHDMATSPGKPRGRGMPPGRRSEV